MGVVIAQNNSALGAFVSFLSLVLYAPLQHGFIPLAILGSVLVAYRQIVVSKKPGVSQTASEVLNGRWMTHVFGIYMNEAGVKLATASKQDFQDELF